MKRELTPESTSFEKILALIRASGKFDSDFTQLIGRDKDGKLLFIAIYAKGEEAAPFERFLKRRERLAKA